MALRALNKESDNDKARWVLIKSFIQLGQKNEARLEYQKLSGSFRSRPEITAEFSLFLADQNEWVIAERRIKEALKEAPDDHWVNYFQGLLYQKKAEHEKALSVFESIQKKYPNSPWPLIRSIESLVYFGECNSATQIKNILVRYLPRWPWTKLGEAQTYLCSGDIKNATTQLDEAIRLGTEFTEAKKIKARLLLDTQNFKELGLLVRPWLDQKVNEAMGYSYLAESLYWQKKWELSGEMAIASNNINPDDPWPYVWLAFSRHHKKDASGAMMASSEATERAGYDQSVRGFVHLFLSQLNPSDSFILEELGRAIRYC